MFSNLTICFIVGRGRENKTSDLTNRKIIRLLCKKQLNTHFIVYLVAVFFADKK